MKIIKMALTQKHLFLPITTIIAKEFCFVIIIFILLGKIVNVMKDNNIIIIFNPLSNLCDRVLK